MSLYQTGPPRPKVMAKAILAPAPVLAAGVVLFKAEESLLAVRSHRVIDALFVFALVILPMIAMITLLFLLSSADPTTAVPGAVHGIGMLHQGVDRDDYVEGLAKRGIVKLPGYTSSRDVLLTGP
jgi:hypothetical protein